MMTGLSTPFEQVTFLSVKVARSDDAPFGTASMTSATTKRLCTALANSCALHGKPCSYIVWGVEDGTHRIVGTSFRLREAKVGNEELENWLAHHLTPRIAVHMHEVDVDGTPVVFFAIQPATNRPVQFKGTEYIRIGSYKKSCTTTRKRSASSGAFSSGHPLRIGWRNQEHRPMMSYR
jgi:predicted HTH transcriptional regulator